MTEENEKRVRTFYEATVPGHREPLWGLQASHVVYDLPEGMPVGGGHFEGLLDVTERFLSTFYEAFDVRFVAEDFITAGEHVVAIGRIKGTARKTAVPVNVPFVPSGQSARGVSNECEVSPTQRCWPVRWPMPELRRLSLMAVFSLREQCGRFLTARERDLHHHANEVLPDSLEGDKAAPFGDEL